jgi:hypothetical protein
MHFIAQLEGRLYCSNPFQMTQAIPYLIIQVKAQAVIPKLTAGSAIFLRDLNCTRGNFQIMILLIQLKLMSEMSFGNNLHLFFEFI